VLVFASTAVKLAECGAKVAVNYFKSEAKATKVSIPFDPNALRLCWWAEMYAAQQVESMLNKTVSNCTWLG